MHVHVCGIVCFNYYSHFLPLLTSIVLSVFDYGYQYFYMGSFPRKKGPNAYIITFPMHNRNVMLAFKCMANQKFRALQILDRYFNSQCVRINV